MATNQTWVAVTKDNLKAFLNDDQLEALTADNKASGQSDRDTVVIPTVCDEMRDDIENNGQNVVDSVAHTVPPGLVKTAVWLILNQLSLTHSAVLKLTDEQKTEVKDAKARMERIRTGEQKVAAPVLAAGSTMQTNGATAVEYNELQTTRDQLTGL